MNDLTSIEKQIFQIINQAAEKSAPCPKDGQIADALNLNIGKAYRELKKLEKKGYLKKIKVSSCERIYKVVGTGKKTMPTLFKKTVGAHKKKKDTLSMPKKSAAEIKAEIKLRRRGSIVYRVTPGHDESEEYVGDYVVDRTIITKEELIERAGL